ncbi:MAG: PAS domain S-box protein [Candidatus Omnitrophica bacterium]|nr:PAS domain S-box protein [Candidatus Omnitrophota bacterium]
MRERIKVLFSSILHFRYLILISSIVFVLVMSAAFYLVYQNAEIMRQQINQNFNQQQLILARQVATQIDEALNDIIKGMNSVKRHMAAGLDESARREALSSFLEWSRSKGVIDVQLLDAGGRLIEQRFSPPAESAPPVESPPPSLPIEGDPLQINQLRLDQRDDGQIGLIGMFHLSIPLNGSRSGTLIARVNITQTIQAITQNIRSGRTGYAWVINQAGVFLYHPERAFIGRNAFTVREERMPYISFSQINRIMKDEMLEGLEGTGMYESGWHRGVEGKMTKLIAYTPVRSLYLAPEIRWSVAVAAPISEVEDVVRTIYRRHFITEAILIAGIFVFGLLSVVYQRQISRTLKRKVSVQEEYLSSILHNSVDAIIFIDNDNRIQMWNKGAEIIFGYNAGEMLGRSFRRLMPPEIDAEEELNNIYDQVLKKGFIHHRAQRITKDGRRITVDLSRTLIRSKDDKILGSTAIIKDVTGKIEMEQRIYHTEKLASIGILAAGVAHEINNPLAIILGFTDLMLERFPEDSPEYNDLKIIEDSANHAKKVVENMLGFARISEGLDDSVDVPHSIDALLKVIQNTLMTRKIELVCSIPPFLPRVRGDPREFQQVLFNLISNSIAAMTDERKVLTISAMQEDAFVHVRVSDTGVGIPDKIKSRIFDPFFTSKKVEEGTGLGLSLCYGIVKKYGGELHFTSVSQDDHPGRPSGTTFTASFPILESERRDAPSPS